MNTPEGRIFSSWKEIATYLGKGVRTVQRWEKTIGLPVRRPKGSYSNVIVATERELREWLESGEAMAHRQNDSEDFKELQRKIERLEAMHKRLIELITRFEERLARIDTAFNQDPLQAIEFNDGDHHRRSKDVKGSKGGNGSKERFGKLASRNPRNRDGGDGDGGSSSGLT